MRYFILILIFIFMPIRTSSADMISNGKLYINGNFIIVPRTITVNQFLLLEDGSFLLLEDGSKIIL